MSGTGRVAQAEICESGYCQVGHLLVRGDRISFVSNERVRQSGAKRSVDGNGRVVWNPRMPVADITLPKDYVVVHDTSGTILSACDLYIVRWYKRPLSSSKTLEEQAREVMSSAREYYGPQTPIRVGSVDVPEGPWKREAGKIAFIRYRRVGEGADVYEHDFNPSIDIYRCERPLAWRMPLPEGCVITADGFERP